MHRDGAPPEFAVPTVFSATRAYFPGLLSVYNMLDHSYLLQAYQMIEIYVFFPPCFTVHVRTRKLALETSRAVIPSAIVLLYKCFIEGLDSARPPLAYGSCQGSPLTSSQRKMSSPAYQMIRSSFRISVHIRKMDEKSR